MGCCRELFQNAHFAGALRSTALEAARTAFADLRGLTGLAELLPEEMRGRSASQHLTKEAPQDIRSCSLGLSRITPPPNVHSQGERRL